MFDILNDPSQDPAVPNHKRPAHSAQVRRGNDPVILHVTTCLRDRRVILSSIQVHTALREVWDEADHWVVGFYVVMPDHMHLFCAP